MSDARAVPTDNRLLAALPPAELRRLATLLEPVAFAAGSEVPEGALLFPARGCVALGHPLSDGSAVAVALVGREGLLGAAQVLGGPTPPLLALVQSPLQAFRLPARALPEALAPGAALPSLARRALQALLVEAAQTAVCNRHHGVDQQLCRWLLLCLDRQDGCELGMTHEAIAQLLGVRREGVTAAAGRLQDAGVIRTGRGRVQVPERELLEQRACECYRVAARECLRLLPAPRPRLPLADSA